MEKKLHEFTEDKEPIFRLTKPILHPTNRQSVIGHLGVDKNRDLNVGTFPRTKAEHWFRGNSSSGLTGYGVSEDVLDRLNRAGTTTDRIVIVETDEGNVIEYECSDFEDATIVAYAPDLNESVIGDDLMRVDDDVYHDRQRVIPVDEARQVFTREEVTICQ